MRRGGEARWVTIAEPAAAGLDGGVVDVRLVVARGLVPSEPPSWLPLVADDWARLRAFRREADARRFLTGRVIVAEHAREVLGDHAGRLRFVRRLVAAGEEKPRYAPAPGERWAAPVPDVSISHSGEVVVVAFCADADVGVDVEQHAAFAGLDDAALRVVLSAAERQPLRTRADVADAFTAKEAVLKAVGWGLAVDPLRLEVRDGRVTRFDAPQARPVSLCRLEEPGEASASLAVAARA
ncbi:4'-phosphopantetheinyl transferase family protein [Cellulomonas timonensis]|uniref:4'-phosphopantetheinyl transferase family protein n=1 Tax=Cellulomonas timonensis TaxID=1689271 RepID=UPI000A8A309D|nr:4'-phosphopantetheinyl transferase superfamily protein [Cellulomonas timonensis]